MLALEPGKKLDTEAYIYGPQMAPNPWATVQPTLK